MVADQEWESILQIKTAGRDDSRSDAEHHPYEPTDYCVLERLAKHHRHFKHIGRVKANALGLFVLNHGIINPFGSVVFCLYLPLRGCQPDSPLFRTGQRGRHARYAPG